jgi:hypothetical protein
LARAELAVNTLRLRHAAIRYLHLLAGYPGSDRGGRGLDHLRRHQTRPPPAAQQEDGAAQRDCATYSRAALLSDAMLRTTKPLAVGAGALMRDF